MKRIKVLTYGVLVVMIWILGVCYFANNAYPSDLNEKREIDTILSQLNDPNWRVRNGALCGLIDLLPYYPPYSRIWQVREEYKNDERVRTALINLLTWEIEHQHEPCPNGEIKGEWYAEYESCLRHTVLSLEDPRALPFFINEDFTDILATKFIVKFANPEIVKTLLKQLETGKKYLPYDARGIGNSLEVLGEIVKKKEGYIVTGTIREEIKQDIIKILKEYGHPTKAKGEENSYYIDRVKSQSYIRKRAIKALGDFEDPGLIPIIRPYLNDSYSETREKTEVRQEGKKATVVKLGEVTIYRVREEAQRVLKLLEEKKKEEEARKETENKKK